MSEIVLKSAFENVSVEKIQLTFNFIIGFPASLESCSFAEVIDASSMFLSLNEISLILVFVNIFETSSSLRNSIFKISNINTSVHKYQFTLPMPFSFYKISQICLLCQLIFMIAVTRSFSLLPFAFIYLFRTEIQAISVFESLTPSATIVSIAIIIVVESSALHQSLLNSAIVYLSIAVQINSFSVKIILIPGTKVDISFWVSVYTFSLSKTVLR